MPQLLQEKKIIITKVGMYFLHERSWFLTFFKVWNEWKNLAVLFSNQYFTEKHIFFIDYFHKNIRKRDKTFYHVVFNHYGFLPTLYRVEKNHFHETVFDKYGTSYIVG